MISNQQRGALIFLAAELVKLDLPDICIEGVESNLRLLATHARTLETWLDRERDEAP